MDGYQVAMFVHLEAAALGECSLQGQQHPLGAWGLVTLPCLPGSRHAYALLRGRRSDGGWTGLEVVRTAQSHISGNTKLAFGERAAWCPPIKRAERREGWLNLSEPSVRGPVAMLGTCIVRTLLPGASVLQGSLEIKRGHTECDQHSPWHRESP